jgi:RNA polymerase sigma factor (sigma-70 family)
MPHPPWWITISTAQLLDLRRRLVEHVTAQFGTTLSAELEDVVQYAFVALFRRREHVSPDNDGLFRYLKTVANHAAIDEVRSDRRRQELLPKVIPRLKQPADTEPVSEATPAEAAEENDRIWKIFCALDDLERLIIWGHVVEGRPIRAVARDLGLNWHRVARTVERVLRRIRAELST